MKKLLLALVLLGGCISQNAPLEVRWFDPLPPAGSVAELRSDVPAIRIRRVRAPAWMRDRIATRTSAVELGFHDDLRWTDAPPKLVEEALERELFIARAIPRAVSERSAVLDVEVTSFEEAREGLAASGVVGVRARLGDARDRVVLERDFVARVPMSGDGGAAIAAAIRAALAQVARELGEQVMVRLGGAPERGPG